MEIKDKRLELRLSESELEALQELTFRAGLRYRSKWIVRQIESEAVSAGIWKRTDENDESRHQKTLD